MADVEERSFQVGSRTDDAVIGASVHNDTGNSLTGWHLRSHLRPPAVVRHIGTRIARALRSSVSAKQAPSLQSDASSQSAAIELARLSIGDDDMAAAAFVAAHRAGTSADAVLIDLLAPAARHLGELWASDEADFAFVTLGMNRLHRILREISDHLDAGPQTVTNASVLLTVIPGEQHSFGLAMVAEFFRRAGWNLCIGPFETRDELVKLVANHWFDVVGFSVSSDRRLAELKTDIENIRRTSRNQHVAIILGGPLVLVQPELLTSIGADGMSADALTAPQQARSLVGRMVSRH